MPTPSTAKGRLYAKGKKQSKTEKKRKWYGSRHCLGFSIQLGVRLLNTGAHGHGEAEIGS